jgi:branched-chain amino acid transport system ATP-binding protein
MLIPCLAKRDGAFQLNGWSRVVGQQDVIDKAEEMLRDMNMFDKRHMHAASLSRGDKRRLEIAMCLAQDPRLLLLD